MTLSPKMQAALLLLEEDGQPVKAIGRATVSALMCRGLVELDAPMKRVYLPPSEHTHAWRMTMHLDGCHMHRTGYECECGALRSTWWERSIKADPYSAIWMEESDGSKPCTRCAQLLAGARPQHDVTTIRGRTPVAA